MALFIWTLLLLHTATAVDTEAAHNLHRRLRGATQATLSHTDARQKAVSHAAHTTKTQYRPRVGLEVELDGTELYLYKADAADRKKIAPIEYSQIVMQTNARVMGTPLFAVTIDGNKPRAGPNNIPTSEEVTDALKRFVVQDSERGATIQEDWSSLGCIELVTGPIELATQRGDGDTPHKDVQMAMSTFLEALKSVRACPPLADNIINGIQWYGSRVVKFSEVLDQYHVLLDAKANPGKWNPFKLENPGRILSFRAGYSWYINCNNNDPGLNLQVNFGYPLDNYGLIPGAQQQDITDLFYTSYAGNLQPRETVAAVNLNKMRVAAKAVVDARAGWTPVARQSKAIRGMITLLFTVAFNNWKEEFLFDNQPTTTKDQYQLLPKVRWGDVLDAMHPYLRSQFATYLQQTASRDDKALQDDKAKELADLIIAQNPICPTGANGNRGFVWNDENKNNLKAQVYQILTHPRGDSAAGLSKVILPFHLDDDPTKLDVAFVIEARISNSPFNQKFRPGFTQLTATDPTPGLDDIRAVTVPMVTYT